MTGHARDLQNALQRSHVLGVTGTDPIPPGWSGLDGTLNEAMADATRHQAAQVGARCCRGKSHVTGVLGIRAVVLRMHPLASRPRWRIQAGSHRPKGSALGGDDWELGVARRSPTSSAEKDSERLVWCGVACQRDSRHDD